VPPKNVKKAPNWESSMNRFNRGEHIEVTRSPLRFTLLPLSPSIAHATYYPRPQAIAVTQDTGRPVKPSTIVSHLCTALLNGNAVDLRCVTFLCCLKWGSSEYSRLAF
jgi:hypothetical protein